MTYEEILNMIANAVTRKFYHGTDYDGLKNTIVECATNVYIAQMQLEKEKLQLEESNRKSNEPVERRQTLADWIKEQKETAEDETK